MSHSKYPASHGSQSKRWLLPLLLALSSLISGNSFAGPPILWGQPGAKLLQDQLCFPNGSCIDSTEGGLGTVTSVALALPPEFLVTGSPITGGGTLMGAWIAQSAHAVLAGPTPSFRLLEDADIPDLSGRPLSSTGPTPTAVVNSNAGIDATCDVARATDSAGELTLVTTSTTPAAGVQCAVMFSAAFATAPICTLAPANSVSSLAYYGQGIYQTSATDRLSINFSVPDPVGQTYVWTYHCVETQ